MRDRSRFLFLNLILLTAPAFASGAPDSRLIEVAPGVQRWMNPHQIAELSEFNHDSGKCGGFFDVTDLGAWGDLSELAVQQVITYPEPAQAAVIEPILSKINATPLRDRVLKLSSFKNRYYKGASGVESMNWIKSEFERLSKGRGDVSVRLVKHSKFDQPSVVATIQGTELANEIVIVGGHGDSIVGSFGMTPNNPAPGADDNASGTATVLTVFEQLMQNDIRPVRTIEFMIYAGEELGLLGSAEIAKSYQAKGTKVVGVMQFDMTMFPGGEEAITLITDFTNASLNAYVKKLNATYVRSALMEDTCGYGCSDHASWTRAGYPSSIPFESRSATMNKKLHTTNDLIDILSPEFGVRFARLGTAFAIELGLTK